jgi:hypothetical protein
MTSNNSVSPKSINEDLLQLEAKRIELGFLKMVVSDLRSYRKMIGFKKYD